jgi:hypothetical protein
MDVFESVRTLLAVREYEDKPVPPETVGRIVEAGRLTASSQNKQPWHFIVVERRDVLQELAGLVKSGPYIAQAAFAIVLAIESQSRFGVSDVSRAAQSMMLTAWEEGVGSNWSGGDWTRSRTRSAFRRSSMCSPWFRSAILQRPSVEERKSAKRLKKSRRASVMVSRSARGARHEGSYHHRWRLDRVDGRFVRRRRRDARGDRRD